MKRLFLAWSGARSYRLAKALASCIRNVFSPDSVRCFVSWEIEPGSTWYESLERAISESDAVLLCITPENLRSHWMYFEAGSRLGADRQSRIYTYVLGVEPGDVPDPIRRYQGSEATEEGTSRLLQAIGDVDGPAIESAFSKCWPELDRELDQLKCYRIQELVPAFDRLFQRKTFTEPIEECSDQSWLDRYYGARSTLERLEAIRNSVEARWQPYQITLIQALITEVDGYVRELRKYLIREIQFAPLPGGAPNFALKLDDPPYQPGEVSRVSNKRCDKIRQYVAQLMDPDGAPVFADSLFFISLQPFWRKKQFVQRKQVDTESGRLVLKEHQLRRCKASSWDLDRILYCLAMENRGRENAQSLVRDAEELLKQVERECDALASRDEDDSASAMPLYYSVRALSRDTARIVPLPDPLRTSIRACVADVQRLIENRKLDAGGQMRRRLNELITY